MTPYFTDRQLIDNLLKDFGFKKMIRDSVGPYKVKMNWAKGTISFVGKNETAHLKLETILKELKNPTQPKEAQNDTEKNQEK